MVYGHRKWGELQELEPGTLCLWKCDTAGMQSQYLQPHILCWIQHFSVMKADEILSSSTLTLDLSILLLRHTAEVLEDLKQCWNVEFSTRYVFITSNKKPDHWYEDKHLDLRALFRRFKEYISCKEDGTHDQDYSPPTRSHGFEFHIWVCGDQTVDLWYSTCFQISSILCCCFLGQLTIMTISSNFLSWLNPIR